MSHEIALTEYHWWLGNIGPGEGLVPSVIKALLEPMLTKFYDTILCHYATMI